MPSTSNSALSGKPPAKLMMPGLPNNLNNSRMAEVSTLLRRSAKDREGAVDICGIFKTDQNPIVAKYIPGPVCHAPYHRTNTPSP